MAKPAREKYGFCPYCGCGCRLLLQCKNLQIEKTLQDTTDKVAEGKACVKGLTVHESIKTNRLLRPSYRPVKSRGLIECGWNKAYSTISRKLSDLEEYDDNGIFDMIFFVPDGQSSNESNYLFSKLCRSVYNSNNIDSCARLCHQATAVTFNKMMGIPAIPEYSMDDLKDVDCFLMVGTDPAENYPVMFNRVLEAKKSGGKIITVDITSTGTSELSDINLKIGADGVVPFVSWLITKFVDSDKISRDVKTFHNYDEFVESAKEVSQKYPPSTFGLGKEESELVYKTILDGKKIGICFGMGVTQHSNGTQNVECLVGLGLLLGAVIFPNRGKVNVQGAGDMGGYPKWNSDRLNKNNNWNTEFRNHKGKTLTEALYDKDIRFIWAIGGDLAQSMPDLNLLDESLRHKFIVYQGHHPSRLMDFASVVLPTTMITEDDGTITNGERRVRGVVNGLSIPEQTKSSVDIIMEFAEYIGAKGFDFKGIKEITKEIIDVVPGYEGLSVEKIYSNNGEFADKKPKFHKFSKIKYDFEHFHGDGKFPFTLTTSRSKYQFCTGNESRNSKTLTDLSGEPMTYMNPKDMDYIGISDGQQVRITSEVGEIKTKVFKNSEVLKRTIVAQFHFPKLLVNRLTPLILDPQSGTPSYKNVPVRLEVLL